MPFDSKPQTARDRGYQLVYALRHLPESFKWDYSVIRIQNECKTNGCGIGLANKLWPELEVVPEDYIDGTSGYSINKVSYVLGIDSVSADEIFRNPGYYGKDHYGEVTNNMVADALEAELNKLS